MEARSALSGPLQGGLVGEGQMKVFNYRISFDSTRAPEFVDVTDWVQDIVEKFRFEFWDCHCLFHPYDYFCGNQ